MAARLCARRPTVARTRAYRTRARGELCRDRPADGRSAPVPRSRMPSPQRRDDPHLAGCVVVRTHRARYRSSIRTPAPCEHRGRAFRVDVRAPDPVPPGLPSLDRAAPPVGELRAHGRRHRRLRRGRSPRGAGRAASGGRAAGRRAPHAAARRRRIAGPVPRRTRSARSTRQRHRCHRRAHHGGHE